MYGAHNGQSAEVQALIFKSVQIFIASDAAEAFNKKWDFIFGQTARRRFIKVAHSCSVWERNARTLRIIVLHGLFYTSLINTTPSRRAL